MTKSAPAEQQIPSDDLVETSTESDLAGSTEATMELPSFSGHLDIALHSTRVKRGGSEKKRKVKVLNPIQEEFSSEDVMSHDSSY